MGKMNWDKARRERNEFRTHKRTLNARPTGGDRLHIASKYNGTCKGCTRPYKVGDPIAWIPGDARHPDCI